MGERRVAYKDLREWLELVEQAHGARGDSRLLVRMGDREVRRYRGLLLLKPVGDDGHDSLAFRWRGEDAVSLPGWGGVLRFVTVADAEGFDALSLTRARLAERLQSGEAKLI